MFQPYKFVVQAVVQQVDESGTVIGEVNTEPVTLFGCDAVAKFASDFPAELEKAEVK